VFPFVFAPRPGRAGSCWCCAVGRPPLFPGSVATPPAPRPARGSLADGVIDRLLFSADSHTVVASSPSGAPFREETGLGSGKSGAVRRPHGAPYAPYREVEDALACSGMDGQPQAPGVANGVATGPYDAVRATPLPGARPLLGHAPALLRDPLGVLAA